MEITIKRLTEELISDYHLFFDVTPHSERPDSDDCKCYCVWWSGDDQNSEVFDKYLSSREKRREYAAECIRQGKIQGYLAYFEDRVVGWCNANTKANCKKCFCWQNFMGFVPEEEKEKEIKTKSIFCFAVAQDMRRKGIAHQLLERVCTDAAEDGFDSVEAYPNASFKNQAEDFMGPEKMFENAGFTCILKTEQKLLMRKNLR